MTTAVGKAGENKFAVPSTMKAWVLEGPEQLKLTQKPVPEPGRPRCWCELTPAPSAAPTSRSSRMACRPMIEGGLPFNKGWTPGHEYMGTIVKLGPGVDEWNVGDRVAVEVHLGCGQCERCRAGNYTACTNYGKNYGEQNKGHRANGFTTEGGYAEYAVNHINTLVHVPDWMSDEEATLIVTAGTALYGLDVLGGLIAGESLVVTGPGPIGLMGVAVGKALGADPVILTGTRDARLEIGKKLGADYVVNVTKEKVVDAIKRITGGKGVHYVLECSGSPNALNEALDMVKRGRKDLPGRLRFGIGTCGPGQDPAQ